jgi:hypothetical protein
LDKKVLEEIKKMTKMYQQLAKILGLSLTETLLVIASRELVILNESTSKETPMIIE